jgi:haloacetate dehalogenase
MNADLLPGFDQRFIETEPGMTIHARMAGSGPPLLLLHGHPQNLSTWYKVAPILSQRFTVVAADLRGYGDSAKRASDPQHACYSKRAMAKDQVRLMQRLGYERFGVIGHDRGGRVAHRMALDFPHAVERVVVLDIAPTLTMYERTNQEFATRYFWWFFLIQSHPLPERMIGADPEFYLRHHLRGQSRTPGVPEEALVQEYLRCYRDAAAIHAICEDYRAAATIDLEHDREDDSAGRRVKAPLLALWGEKGTVGQLYDVLATWREKAARVDGHALPCGHLLQEESPDLLVRAVTRFLDERD